jgi:thiol-disulfide isomerase/thioredoxin
MMTHHFSWTAFSLACLVPLLSATSQDSGKKAGKQEAKAGHWEFKRLNRKVKEAHVAFVARKRRDAKKAFSEFRPTKAMRFDMSVFTEDAMAGARRYAGTDDALQFLIFAWRVAKSRKTLYEVSQAIQVDHIESDKLAGHVAILSRRGHKLGLIEHTWLMHAIKYSPSKAVQGAFHFQRADTALRDRKATAEVKRAALDEVRLALKLAPNASFAKRAAIMIYAADKLAIGMKSPEISGTDTDGVAFKLSDYKGKVILLDFWGDWRGPCRAMYPHERSLVKKYASAPFALVGVNSDKKIERVHKALKDNNISWRSFWQGEDGTAGPISTKWNVATWPTVVYIDHKGVIRYRAHRVDNDLLDKLIGEAKADQGQVK